MSKKETTIVVGDLIAGIDVLNELSVRKLPIYVSYPLARSLKTLEKELNVYNASRQDLIKAYADKDDSGNPVLQEDENNNMQYKISDMPALIKELQTLLEQEIEIEVYPISQENLEKDDKIEMSAGEIMTLVSLGIVI